MKLTLLCLFFIYYFDFSQAVESIFDQNKLTIDAQQTGVTLKNPIDGISYGNLKIATKKSTYGTYNGPNDAINPKFYAMLFDKASNDFDISYNFAGLDTTSHRYEIRLSLDEHFNRPNQNQKCPVPKNELFLVDLYADSLVGNRIVEIGLTEQLRSGVNGRSGATGATYNLYKISNEDSKGELIGCGIAVRKYYEEKEPLKKYFDAFLCSNGITLTENKLKELEGTNFDTTKETLDLQNKDISCIEETTFNNFKNLKTLDLSKNNIIFLSSETFRENDKLETLNLAHNKLFNLEESLITTLINLQNMDLNGNKKLEELHDGFFIYNKALSKLSIYDTGLDKNKRNNWNVPANTDIVDQVPNNNIISSNIETKELETLPVLAAEPKTVQTDELSQAQAEAAKAKAVQEKAEAEAKAAEAKAKAALAKAIAAQAKAEAEAKAAEAKVKAAQAKAIATTQKSEEPRVFYTKNDRGEYIEYTSI